uniref:Uncharacterized protein n=1 Tax=Seriola dumerili TaxID=41447 RepID=A0A3B4V6L0_SERDU
EKDVEQFLKNASLPKLISNPVRHLRQTSLCSRNHKSTPTHKFIKQFWHLLSPLFFPSKQQKFTKIKLFPPCEYGLHKHLSKSNKDHTHCSNYRPISLINTDIKIN